ncbi:hypothetical protein TNCV_2073441 [Trichonephila clavipes]|uniref:Uncharacterized protein n=1 Tax=Trichonephila clavipes TaxID=2585209 RepID=A0A8X6US71_TRICX|nr:hypothetical protein TNCV_2073441 [Trichonephila clavipes]
MGVGFATEWTERKGPRSVRSSEEKVLRFGSGDVELFWTGGNGIPSVRKHNHSDGLVPPSWIPFQRQQGMLGVIPLSPQVALDALPRDIKLAPHFKVPREPGILKTALLLGIRRGPPIPTFIFRFCLLTF